MARYKRRLRTYVRTCLLTVRNAKISALQCFKPLSPSAQCNYKCQGFIGKKLRKRKDNLTVSEMVQLRYVNKLE